MTQPNESVVPDSEEPRGPHLPDAITRVPWQAWPFIALVVVPALAGVMFGPRIELDPGLILRSIATCASILLGAALFIRHPDAWTRHRPLVIAAVLIVVAEAIQQVAPFIVVSVLEPAAFDAQDPFFLAQYWVGVASAVVALFAQAYLWLGLDGARRYEDPPGSRAVISTLLVFTLVLITVSAAWYVRFGINGVAGFGFVQVAVSLVLQWIGALVGVALAAVLIAGARADEAPSPAWWIAAMSALVSSVGVGVVTIAVSGASIIDPSNLAGLWLIAIVLALGPMLLFIAFAVGLPGPGPEPNSSSVDG